ncbi:MAG TPA: hypothetical protein VGF75_06820 [Candidatus Saccharimonadales bacterium]|jgi:hypothetical protein
MVTKAQTTTQSEAETLIEDAFPGVVFETVYEGIGETWDFKTHPVLVGVFMRREETEMLKYGSKTETEMRRVYTIKTASGDLAAVWDSFSLSRAFQDIEPQSVVRITYVGKNQIGDTDKEVKDFKVEVAKS